MGKRKAVNDIEECQNNITVSTFWNRLKSKKRMLNSRLVAEDFRLPCKEMALYLLGKVLVRKLGDGSILKGKIVETEGYLGGEDKASHSYNGRKTPTTEPMYMPAGTSYVYFTYGLYYCFNISSLEPGAAVLIRALHPLEGIGHMHRLRASSKRGVNNDKPLKDKELCNGPSKLCMSMNITKEACNKLDLCTSDELWLEDEMGQEEMRIVTSTRIGIASAGEEWARKPLRYYVLANPHVSKRDRKAESELTP